jgi:hypothetical protein
MRTLRVLPLVLLVAAAVGCGVSDAGLKLIHVDDLVALLRSHEGAVTLLDANGADFRAKEGVIPGAVLLSSYRTYDVEKELPPRRDTRLVFYCADSH